MTHGDPFPPYPHLADLPRLYEPEKLEDPISVMDAATERARAGAAEGTLLWSTRQSGGRGRLEQEWRSPPGNLYCALIIRPDYPPDRALELCVVAALSAGLGLAELVAPPGELRYRWPNDVMLSHGKVAGIHIAAPPLEHGALEWLVIGLSVNVATTPAFADFRASGLADDGGSQATPEEVLVRFARHFLSSINLWAEEGLAGILGRWRQRLDGLEGPVRVALKHGVAQGTFADLGDDGAMVLDAGAGTRRISLAEFFGIDLAEAAPPGVYLLPAQGPPRLVHAYHAESDYVLDDVIEHLGIGRFEGAGPDRALVLDAPELRRLKVAADAYSFDHDPGFIEMCVEISRVQAPPRTTVRLVSRP